MTRQEQNKKQTCCRPACTKHTFIRPCAAAMIQVLCIEKGTLPGKQGTCSPPNFVP
jgi:hypothetical protein